MNANGASSFRLKAHFLQWRHQPPRARPARVPERGRCRRSVAGAGSRFERRPERPRARAWALVAPARGRRATVCWFRPAHSRRFVRACLVSCSHLRARPARACAETRRRPRLVRCRLRSFRDAHPLCLFVDTLYTPPWSDVRLPAELKHITKRRRRKQP